MSKNRQKLDKNVSHLHYEKDAIIISKHTTKKRAKSETVYQRKADNTMVKWKRTKDKQGTTKQYTENYIE